MPLTPQDVHSKVFGPTRFRRGYDEAEVDAFLDEVEGELIRLHREIDDLRAQLGSDGSSGSTPAPTTGQDAAGPAGGEASAGVPSLTKDEAAGGPAQAGVEGRADDGGDLEQRVARTLVLAQRAADEALRDAETQAEQMRLAAQAEVERLRAESEAAADRQRAALESERTSAEDDVEQLRAFEREYRTRLRAYLELQLRELDSSGGAQVESAPAAALPAETGNAAVSNGAAGGAAGQLVGSASSVPGQEDGHGAASSGTAQYATGGVSDRAAGEEQGHEPPRDGV